MSNQNGLAIAVAALLVCAGIEAGKAWAATAERPVPQVTANGRFVIHNPQPTLGKTNFLLDTWTGRVWAACSLDESDPTVTTGTGWCEMGNVQLKPENRFRP